MLERYRLECCGRVLRNDEDYCNYWVKICEDVLNRESLAGRRWHRRRPLMRDFSKPRLNEEDEAVRS